jgi:hypothetical protein
MCGIHKIAVPVPIPVLRWFSNTYVRMHKPIHNSRLTSLACRGAGQMTSSTGLDERFTAMETCTRGCGRLGRATGQGATAGRTGMSTTGSGVRAGCTGRGRLNGTLVTHQHSSSSWFLQLLTWVAWLVGHATQWNVWLMLSNICPAYARQGLPTAEGACLKNCLL